MSTPANSLNIQSPGYVVFDGVSVFTGRTFQAGTGITLSNADGISGDTTIGLTGGGVGIDSFIPDAGTSPVVPTASGEVSLLGTHGINTLGGTNSVTFGINNAITLGDLSAIAANSNALSATTGDINIAAGNLKLPNTNAGLTEGVITWAVGTRIHNFGTNNIFIGNTSGNGTLTVGNATNNVGVGLDTLKSLTTGVSNTAIGSNAGSANNSGNENVFVGRSAGIACNGGGQNIFIGKGCATSFTSGSSCVIIGNDTASAYGAGCSSNIVIGASIAGVAGEDNKIRLGQSGSGTGQQNACYIGGIAGVNVGSVASVVTNSGDQLGTATITAGTGVTITPGANTITINAAGGGLTWSVVTVDASFTANTGTIANKAGLLTMTLPASGAIGDIIRITGINSALGWKIAQNANQQIFMGTSVGTTVGTGGSIASINIRDSLEMVCVVAGASTVWNVLSSEGNFTIV